MTSRRYPHVEGFFYTSFNKSFVLKPSNLIKCMDKFSAYIIKEDGDIWYTIFKKRVSAGCVGNSCKFLYKHASGRGDEMRLQRVNPEKYRHIFNNNFGKILYYKQIEVIFPMKSKRKQVFTKLAEPSNDEIEMTSLEDEVPSSSTGVAYDNYDYWVKFLLPKYQTSRDAYLGYKMQLLEMGSELPPDEYLLKSAFQKIASRMGLEVYSLIRDEYFNMFETSYTHQRLDDVKFWASIIPGTDPQKIYVDYKYKCLSMGVRIVSHHEFKNNYYRLLIEKDIDITKLLEDEFNLTFPMNCGDLFNKISVALEQEKPISHDGIDTSGKMDPPLLENDSFLHHYNQLQNEMDIFNQSATPILEEQEKEIIFTTDEIATPSFDEPFPEITDVSPYLNQGESEQNYEQSSLTENEPPQTNNCAILSSDDYRPAPQEEPSSYKPKKVITLPNILRKNNVYKKFNIN